MTSCNFIVKDNVQTTGDWQPNDGAKAKNELLPVNHDDYYEKLSQEMIFQLWISMH